MTGPAEAGSVVPASAPPGVHPWVAEQKRRIRFGVGPQRPDWPALLDWVRHLEALGFDSFWVEDHPARTFDVWTTLAALAVSTTTIRLGTSVSCVSYRSPVELARLAADVDRLSGGRLVLGLGIGDAPGEFAQFALPMHIALPLVLAETEAALQAKLGEGARRSSGLVAGTPEQALAYYRDLVAAGMRYFIVATGDAETVRLLAEHVMPALTPV